MAPNHNAQILVLGGGYAGLTAAARLGEAGLSSRISLIDAKPGFVERIRLHEVAGGSAPRSLLYAPFLVERNVNFIEGRAHSLDPARGTMRVARTQGGEEDIRYDWLVYALGSRTDPAGVLGATEFALTLDTVTDARAIWERAERAAERGGRALIVGGGLTGIECAAELAEKFAGLSVVIAIGSGFTPVSGPGGLSPGAVDHVRAVFARLGVTPIEHTRVSELRDGIAVMENGESITCDLCVWAAGFRAPPLARAAGLEVDALDRIVTDERLRSVSHPNVLAIGDAAAVRAAPNRLYRMSCAAGRPMGEAAAAALARLISGEEPEPFAYRYSFRCVSLGRDDGLIQFVDDNDAPAAEFWSGRRGAAWKEYICRRTLAGIGLDRGLGPPPDTPPERLSLQPAG